MSDTFNVKLIRRPTKYAILKEMINDWLITAREDAAEAIKVAGMNCYGAGFAEGEASAYSQVLSDIAELEAEVTVP